MAEAKNVNTQDLLELPVSGDIRKVCIPVLVKGVGSSSMKNHCYFSEFLTAAAAVAATSVLLLLLLLCQDCVVFFLQKVTALGISICGRIGDKG